MGKVIRVPSIRADVVLTINAVKGYSETNESAKNIFNDVINAYELSKQQDELSGINKFQEYYDEQIDYINKHKKDILEYIKTGIVFSQNKGSITEYD